jgi:hypothetical protein
MNRFSQTTDLPKKKRPNLKWKRRVKNRSRPVIRPDGRGGESPKKSTTSWRMNSDGEGGQEEIENQGKSYPARRVKAS